MFEVRYKMATAHTPHRDNGSIVTIAHNSFEWILKKSDGPLDRQDSGVTPMHPLKNVSGLAEARSPRAQVHEQNRRSVPRCTSQQPNSM